MLVEVALAAAKPKTSPYEFGGDPLDITYCDRLMENPNSREIVVKFPEDMWVRTEGKYLHSLRVDPRYVNNFRTLTKRWPVKFLRKGMAVTYNTETHQFERICACGNFLLDKDGVPIEGNVVQTKSTPEMTPSDPSMVQPSEATRKMLAPKTTGSGSRTSLTEIAADEQEKSPIAILNWTEDEWLRCAKDFGVGAVTGLSMGTGGNLFVTGIKSGQPEVAIGGGVLFGLGGAGAWYHSKHNWGMDECRYLGNLGGGVSGAFIPMPKSGGGTPTSSGGSAPISGGQPGPLGPNSTGPGSLGVP